MARTPRLTSIGWTTADMVYRGYAVSNLGNGNGWIANRFHVTFNGRTFEAVKAEIDARMMRLFGC